MEKVNIFRGVPFAEPPVGPLRFRPPVASKPWSGERDATKFSASAMQWRESTSFGEQPFVHSEDCLYLNIWAPEGKGPFPVFVWIHGGGYISGHAFGPIHDGSEFARQGIISVTLPYRLGVLGFLDVSPLLGPEYAGSANNALRDLMTALEWIQKNISAFNGDPDRVTIGGESAGAKVTDILMGVPAAQPLFHQMISESGGAERVWSKTAAAAVSRGYGELWRKQSGQDSGQPQDRDRRGTHCNPARLSHRVAATLPASPRDRRRTPAANAGQSHRRGIQQRQAPAHRHQPRRKRALYRAAPGPSTPLQET